VSAGLLILDFDGTVCLGDAPVLAYARAVARSLGDPESGILTPLSLFLEGAQDGPFAGCADGYSAVAQWGRRYGLDDHAMSAAYRESRVALDAGELSVATPPGIGEFLAGFQDWDRVLVTNAPREGTVKLVTRLGLTPFIDRVIGDARKPEGLRTLIAAGGELDLARWERALSIGDIWRNDLEPVADRATTALIERHAQPGARPALRAPLISQLFAPLAHWRNSGQTPA